MRRIVLLMGLFLGVLNINSSIAATGAPKSSPVKGAPTKPGPPTSIKQNAQKDAKADMIFVLDAALYEATKDTRKAKAAAQLVRDMIFAPATLPLSPFLQTDVKKISEVGTLPYTYVVASAYLLAFAFPDDDFWKELKNILSYLQNTPNPVFDNKNSQHHFLGWYAGLIKLFQRNLGQTIPI